MKASIIYNSEKGTTKAYAEEIAQFLSQKGVEVTTASISDYDVEALKTADIVLLGAWTSGLFFFAQHPDKKWKQFVKDLPDMSDKRVGLFTTYLILTGSMFSNMEKELADKTNGSEIYLKSRGKKLTEENISALENFIS